MEFLILLEALIFGRREKILGRKENFKKLKIFLFGWRENKENKVRRKENSLTFYSIQILKFLSFLVFFPTIQTKGLILIKITTH